MGLQARRHSPSDAALTFFNPVYRLQLQGDFFPKMQLLFGENIHLLSQTRQRIPELASWFESNTCPWAVNWNSLGKHSFDVPLHWNWKYQNEYSSYLVFLGVRNSDVGGYQVFRTDRVTAPYIILALLNTTRCASDTHCSVDHAMQCGDWNIKNDLVLRAIIEMAKLA